MQDRYPKKEPKTWTHKSVPCCHRLSNDEEEEVEMASGSWDEEKHQKPWLKDNEEEDGSGAVRTNLCSETK